MMTTEVMVLVIVIVVAVVVVVLLYAYAVTKAGGRELLSWEESLPSSSSSSVSP